MLLGSIPVPSQSALPAAETHSRYYRFGHSNDGTTTPQPGAADFIRPTKTPELCQPGQLLTFRDIEVYKIDRRGSFRIPDWTGSGDAAYLLSAVDAKLKSSSGSIY